MNIRIFDDSRQVGQAAATMVAAQVLKKPDSVLGFATGSTPVPTYKNLVDMHKDGILDFSLVRTFNLDEYMGLPREHKESYYNFMFANLFSHVNIDPGNVHLPDGMAKDPAAECASYEKSIRDAGGIDLQVLGIGSNGHIGFNEPTPVFPMETNIAELTESTINANVIYFENNRDLMPKKAFTMGIGTIMAARSIVMVVTGKAKADIVKRMAGGDIDPAVPASILRCHPCVTVLLDKAAASLL